MTETLPTLLDPLRRALEAVKSFAEVRDIHARAEAMRAFSESRGEAIEQVNHWIEWKLRIERKMGQELRTLERNPGGRPSKTPNDALGVPTFEQLGVTYMQVSRWEALAAIPDADFEQYLVAIRDAGAELTSVGAHKLAAQFKEPRQPRVAAVDEVLWFRQMLDLWEAGSDAGRRKFLEELALLGYQPIEVAA